MFKFDKNSKFIVLNNIAKQVLGNYTSLLYILKWTLLSLLISIFIGSASAGFLQSLNWVTDYRESHLWLIAFLPISGFFIGLLYHYFGQNVDAGNNILIDTIHSPQQTIPFRMAPFVYLGTIVTHLCGGSAGREGTALQMAGSIADQFSKPLRLSASDRKILIIAAVAGGFGSVFGTPLAGAVFALEFFLIGKIRYNALYPACITAIMSDIVTKLLQTPHTQYHMGIVPSISFINILYAVIAGVLFGICAVFFSKSMQIVSGFFKAKIKYAPLRPVLGGIIVAGMVWAMGTTKYIGLGIPTIEMAFAQPLPSYDFALKMLLTVLTLSAGFKGGEVTPLFFIGATLGNALSLFIPLPIGLLAGMGFVGVFAGATNTPLACSIMAIELFGVDCGIYVFLACIISYLISGQNSIYKSQIIGQAKDKHSSDQEGRRMGDI